MEKAEYHIRCKNGIVKVSGYVIDGKPLAWSDSWNDSHYVGIHRLNNGKWGLDDLNTGLALTLKEYKTRKAARKDLEEVYIPKLHALWFSDTYKRQAWEFTKKMAGYDKKGKKKNGKR